MDFKHTNVHMDMVKAKAVTQLTLEGDINLSQNNPDMEKIIFQKGRVKITDTKTSADHVLLKGYLEVTVLYNSEDESDPLSCARGKITFEENVFVQGIKAQDNVNVTWKMEDLSVSVVNSRKISTRSVITLKLVSEALYDEEVISGLDNAQDMEFEAQRMTVSRLAVSQKDIFRIHQDITVPQAYPNIYRLIFENVSLSNMEYKPIDGRIKVTGEMNVFVLYENNYEDNEISSYETSVMVQGEIPLDSCREMMTLDICQSENECQVEIKEDFDQEERIISIDYVLDLGIKLYEDKEISLLGDVYHVRNEVKTEEKEGLFRKIVLKNSGKCKLNEKIEIPKGQEMLQVIHTEGEVFIEDEEFVKEGVMVSGIVTLSVLYITKEDKQPFSNMEISQPFSFLLEGGGLKKENLHRIQAQLSMLHIAMADSMHISLQGLVDIDGLFFDEKKVTLITDITILPPDKDKWKKLPAIVVYIVKEGDTLWQIGKKYYIRTERIRMLNDLKNDELIKGQKLILMKEM